MEMNNSLRGWGERILGRRKEFVKVWNREGCNEWVGLDWRVFWGWVCGRKGRRVRIECYFFFLRLIFRLVFIGFGFELFFEMIFLSFGSYLIWVRF